VLKPSIYNLEGVDEGPDYAGQPMLKVHPDADYGSIILILLTPVYSI
jgi:hypothetical protein